jgi:LacI family transcriptional regulator
MSERDGNQQQPKLADRVARADEGDERPSEAATMKDIAARAGVSIGTVDRVLHSRGRVSPDTAKRVREVARKLDFRPNLVASNLKRAHQRTFVAVLPHPDQDGGFWRQVVNGVERAVEELAHHYIRVRFVHYDRFKPETLNAAADIVTDSRRRHGAAPSGVILAPTARAASTELARRCSPTPVAVLDGELPDAEILCSIAQESRESGLLAAKLLELTAGPGRFLSVVVGSDDYHLLERRGGFEEFFAGGAAPERLEVASNEELTRALAERLNRTPHIDGVFVTNAAAHMVIDALQTGMVVPGGGGTGGTGSTDSAGSSSPDRMGVPPVIGFDLIPENVERLREGSLAFVINQQPERQGYEAVYALYRNTVLKESVESHIRIPVDLVTRETLRFHQGTMDSTKG